MFSVNPKLKIFVCTDHDDHWPVGVASVIIAETLRDARKMLDVELINRGLRPYKEKKYTLTIISQHEPSAHILNDGNY